MMAHILVLCKNGLKNEMNDVHNLLHCMRIAQQISILANN